MTIKAVLFDLDGTLYDRDRLAAALFEEQYDAFAADLRGLSRERFLRDAHEMDDHGYGEKEDGYRKLVRRWRLIAALGLATTFDAILVSEEEGVRKPDAEIFRRALARCGVAAHEAMFVGDHPVADVEGAHRAGLVAVWKHVPYSQAVVPDAAVIRELSDVLVLCAGSGAST